MLPPFQTTATAHLLLGLASASLGLLITAVEPAERVAAQGVQYTVFPETAISGYAFSDPAQLAPIVDTIPAGPPPPCCLC